MANINALNKIADTTPLTETLAGIPAAAITGAIPIPFLGHALNISSEIAGLASPADNSPKGIGRAFLPGVASYRMGNRIKTQVVRELNQIKKDKKNKGSRPVAHAVAERLGSLTSVLASSGLGAGVGALIGKLRGDDASESAEAGAVTGLAGAGVAHILGLIAAAVKRRRTRQEQIDADKGSWLMKYLVPGTGTYGYYKRLGRSQGERDER